MKKLFLSLLVLGLVACQPGADTASNESASKAPSGNKFQSSALKSSNSRDNSAAVSTGVNWITIEELEKASKRDKRKVIVDLYTDWCGWCKRMDKATFQNPEIASYINQNFHAVKMNAEQKSAIKFKGGDHKFVPAGRRGVNELAYKFLAGRMSYPTISFLDEKLELIQPFPGFKKPHQMEPVLVYIDGGHYRDQSLGQFQQSFKSTIKD